MPCIAVFSPHPLIFSTSLDFLHLLFLPAAVVPGFCPPLSLILVTTPLLRYFLAVHSHLLTFCRTLLLFIGLSLDVDCNLTIKLVTDSFVSGI